ncbi:MAG: DUF2752 domain-containing protein [Planctomycetaceae bacterium]|jgi:hypothetical protein|nr:DUF2752 domain-containing protein [Planctomycetaceae bacterium]MBT6154539.1 DUF2752 domain-containing protein [Planctomycetaceae bacterium]MBT6486569.1 DUF2752 domain-containing protein [Planctomycetaceae bacterium]MBT6496802.1 DUF2752 domain-containing protein [Planctomycetaceae bacterium]
MSMDAIDEQHTIGERADDEQPLAEDAAALDVRRRELIRSRHRWALVGVALVLVASFSLKVVDGDRVAMRGFEAYPLPHTCASRMLIQRGCPGCGLTRSFVHLAAGHWQDSLAVHRLGWLLALSFLLQIPYRTAGLLGANPRPLGKRIPAVFGYSLLALLFANWVSLLVV